ncbi:MAG: hypothetical protein ACK4UN_19065, partial [Limisphaerales bacterium]
GKPGPFDASKGNVARAWKLYVMTVERAQFGVEKLIAGDTTIAGWIPLLSAVDGRITRDELQAQVNPLRGRNPMGVFAAARLQLASDAKAKLKLNAAGGTEIWANGKQVGRTREVSGDNSGLQSEIMVDLPQGKHTIVVRMDPKTLPDHLRLESSEGTFLVED